MGWSANKEDIIIDFIKSPRLFTEDIIEYCNKIIAKVKQTRLKTESIISILGRMFGIILITNSK